MILGLEMEVHKAVSVTGNVFMTNGIMGVVLMKNVMRGTKTHPKFQSLSSHTSFVSERIGNREEFNEPRREKIHAELLAVGEACEAIF